MKVTLEQLSSGLEGEKFVLVCATSFEPRWYTSVSNIKREQIDQVIILRQLGFYKAIDDGIDLINSYGVKTSEFDLCSDSPVQKAMVMRNLFLEKISPSDRLVIDITTFTHENMLIFYQFLDQIHNKEKITFIYTGVKEYSVGLPNEEKWLSKGVKGIRSVFGFPGIMYPSLKTHLVILAGFEYERAEKLINELEPEIISIGVARASSHFNIENEVTNAVFFERLDSFIKTTVRVKSRVDTFKFSCSDPYETQEAIVNQVNKYHGYNVVLSPMNTKISTLGAALAAIENDSIQICYVDPVEYNTDSYSSVGDEVTIIVSHLDSITSVGDLICVKDPAVRERFDSLGVDSSLISKYFDARQRKPASTKGERYRDKLLEAAKSFSEISGELDEVSIHNNTSSDGERLLYYYSVMQEALCNILLKDYPKALGLYASLEKPFEGFPMLSHRMGQVYSRMGQYSKAIKSFENAIKLVNVHEEKDKVGGDMLPEADYSHLKEHGPLLLGYQYWAKSISDSALTDDEKAVLLKNAYELTDSVIDYGKVSQKTIREVYNNSLYYVMDLSRLSQSVVPENEVNDSIRKYLNHLDLSYSNDECEDVYILDTLAKARQYIGDIDKALFYARKIIEIIEIGDRLVDTPEGDAGLSSVLQDTLDLIKANEFKILA